VPGDVVAGARARLPLLELNAVTMKTTKDAFKKRSKSTSITMEAMSEPLLLEQEQASLEQKEQAHVSSLT
jgi:hypothetical protein